MLSASLRPEKLTSLIDSDLPKIPCYLGPSVLPLNSILVFGGEAKIGKSLTMMEFARCLSSGDTPFCDPELFVPKAVKVLFLEAEIGHYGLKERAEKIWTHEERRKFKEDNLWYVSNCPEMRIDKKSGRQLLYDMCEQVKPNVLILDPISRMQAYDDNNNQQIGEMFAHLVELKKYFLDQQMSIIFAHHFKKAGDERFGYEPLSPYNFRGSSNFYNTPDSLITMHRTTTHKAPHKWWNLNVRFVLRHGEGVDDRVWSVNKKGDLRVRYERHLTAAGEPTKKLVSLLEPKVVEIPKQGFLTA